MTEIKVGFRDDNIKALLLAGFSVGEAVKMVEQVMANNLRPTIEPSIDEEDVIDAIADWATQAPIAEADILNAD